MLLVASSQVGRPRVPRGWSLSLLKCDVVFADPAPPVGLLVSFGTGSLMYLVPIQEAPKVASAFLRGPGWAISFF